MNVMGMAKQDQANLTNMFQQALGATSPAAGQNRVPLVPTPGVQLPSGITVTLTKPSPGQASLKCILCARAFMTQAALRSHMAMHMSMQDLAKQQTQTQNLPEVQGTMNRCLPCLKSFPSTLRYRVHVKEQHSGQEPVENYDPERCVKPDDYICLICIKKFKNRQGLKTHISSNHLGGANTLEEALNKGTEKKESKVEEKDPLADPLADPLDTDAKDAKKDGVKGDESKEDSKNDTAMEESKNDATKEDSKDSSPNEDSKDDAQKEDSKDMDVSEKKEESADTNDKKESDSEAIKETNNESDKKESEDSEKKESDESEKKESDESEKKESDEPEKKDKSEEPEVSIISNGNAENLKKPEVVKNGDDDDDEIMIIEDKKPDATQKSEAAPSLKLSAREQRLIKKMLDLLKRHGCEFCESRFETKLTLAEHEKTHLEEYQRRVEEDPDYMLKKLKLNADGTPKEKVC